MARIRYRWDGEKMVEISSEGPFVSESPFVLQDSMEPIASMITGETFDSRSQYMRHVKANGCEIVGNDLLSNKPRKLKDNVTEEKVLDALYKAESVLSDPSKRREMQARNERLFEMREKLLRNS